MTAINLNDVKLERMLDNIFEGDHKDGLSVRLEQFRASKMSERLKPGKKLLPSLDVITPEWLRGQLETRVGVLNSRTSEGMTARMLEQAFEKLEQELDRCFQPYGRDETIHQDEASHGLEDALEILGVRLEGLVSREEGREADVELKEGAQKEAGLPNNVVEFPKAKRL